MEKDKDTWSIPANLRWLAEQSDRPGYVPCGELTGRFLNLTADRFEALATRTTDQAKDEEIARLVEELRLWRMLVNEGGVPRYTITPGAALNTIVTSTDAMLRRYPNA